MNLKYDMWDAPSIHPQKAMEDLGIVYLVATPQSIGEQWWFWGCTGNLKNLPAYITELKITPREAIGMGLSVDEMNFLEKKLFSRKGGSEL